MKEDLTNMSQEMLQKIKEVAEYMQSASDETSWFDGKKIDEVAFCDWFMAKHPLKYVGGLFYDIDGVMKKEKLEKEIVDIIKPCVKSALVRKANQIIEALRLEAMCDELPKHTDRVHFKNGTYFLDGGFIPDKEFCSNRLPVNYNAGAKAPTTWLKFLDELLYPEDILTLQEFMGYTFIPTTKAQAMLMLVGSGGEGKSRVGVVCRNLLGDNMNICAINKLSYDRFSPADQEGKLLMIDDDMKMEALSDTGTLKAIVTMEDKMDLERKGQQSYQGYLYVRIMVFGNGALSSLYDKSDGFYRRQITIRVKDKPEGRVDDRNLSEKLATETEGISLWCLDGLKRLASNGFHFTVSDRTIQSQNEMRIDEDSIMDFFESSGYIAFSPTALVTTKDLYDAYQMWGGDNLVKTRSENSFSREVKQRANKLGITYLKNVSMDDKTARGYRGIYALHTLSDVPFNDDEGT